MKRYFPGLGSLVPGCLLFLIMSLPQTAGSATAGASIELNTTGAAPREIEETTKTSVERDYANAWQSMSQALDSGDAAQLDHYWTGVAREKLLQLAKDEKHENLRVHYVDHSHKLQAVFYPTDGSALLLHDVVEGELEILDGGKVVETQPFTQKYVVLMTPGQDRWFVRVFESVPAF